MFCFIVSKFQIGNIFEKILKLGAKGGIEGEGGKITVLQGKISSGVMNICIIYKTPVNLSIFLQALQFVLFPLHMKGQKIIVMGDSNNK